MGYKVDKERKVLVTDTGREIPIPEDDFKDYMKKVGRSDKFLDRKKKYKEQELKDKYSGRSGETYGAVKSGVADTSFINKGPEKVLDAFTAAGHAFMKGEGQEEMSYYQRLGEMFQSSQQGRQEARQEISEKHPYATKVGSAIGLAADIMVPGKGIRGALMAPIIGASTSDVNPFEDTDKWVGGRAIDAAAGYGVDKIVSGFSRIAAQRAKRRNLPSAIKAANVANETARANYKIEEATTAKAIKELPAKQQQARRVFGNEVREQTSKLGTEMSVTQIPRDAIKLDSFINDSINASALAGTGKGKKLTDFFESIVNSRPEKMGWKEIATIINSVEDRIAVAAEEELPILLKFKEHLLKVIPKAVGEASAQRKCVNKVLGAINNLVDREVNVLLKNKPFVKSLESVAGKGGGKTFSTGVKNEVKRIFNNMSPSEFNYIVNTGKVSDVIEEAANNSPLMQRFARTKDKFSRTEQSFLKENKFTPEFQDKIIKNLSKEESLVKKEFAKFVESISDKSPNAIDKFASDLHIETNHVSSLVETRLKKTLGTAQELPQPLKPMQPSLVPIPEKESMGFLGELAEKPLSDFVPSGKTVGGSTLAGGAIGTMVGGSKVLATAGAGAGIAGIGATGLAALKLATDPGVLGDITRRGMSFFGKRLPVYLSNKYQDNFQNGVLVNPKDRLEVSVEIEKDPYMSNQDKAIWQTKINKGQRIR